MSNQAQGLPGHRPRTTVRAQRRNAVRAGIGSRLARPTGLELGVGLTRSLRLRRHELLQVERGAARQHVVGRPAQLVREDREGFPLAMLPLEALEQLLAGGILTEKQDGRLREGPLEVGVADLAAPRAEALAGRRLGAGDQPRVGGEVLDAGEAADVVDLIEDGQGEDFADAGERLEPEEAVRVVLLHRADDVELEFPDEPVVDFDEGEVGLDALPDVGIGERVGDPRAIGPVDDLPRGLGEVVLVVGILDVGEELPALADEVEPAPEQIAGRAHLGGIDVGFRDQPTAQERGDLVGVNPIVLGLAAVDGFHVQRMAEDEGDLLAGAQIGKPVPGEDALDGDDQILPVRGDRAEEDLRVAADVLIEQDLAGLVENAEIHGAGVQVNPTVVSVLAGVESHRFPSCEWGSRSILAYPM
jgi:hypothetical protein